MRACSATIVVSSSPLLMVVLPPACERTNERTASVGSLASGTASWRPWQRPWQRPRPQPQPHGCLSRRQPFCLWGGFLYIPQVNSVASGRPGSGAGGAHLVGTPWRRDGGGPRTAPSTSLYIYVCPCLCLQSCLDSIAGLCSSVHPPLASPGRL
jgi:hypothetical protein